MPKVIYIGNYRDGTGWGNAALNNILAMDSVGIEVVPRCITFGANPVILPEKMKELESRSTRGAEVCIQHTLPPLYTNYKGIKTIGLCEIESDYIGDAMWPMFMNLLDEMWFPNYKGEETALFSGVKVPTHVVHHCLDMDQYDDSDSQVEIPELEGSFVFMFAGELVERKNLEALVKAFHSEFHPTELATLVIKTSLPNVNNPAEQFEYAKEFTTQVRDRLKIRKNYKGDLILCDRLDRANYIGLLKKAHCFVMPSRGEACCIPALEAGALGVPVLYTFNNGMEDYVGLFQKNTKRSYNSVDSRPEPCYNSMDTLPDIHTGNGYWEEISVSNLRQHMRLIFNLYNQDRQRYDTMAAEQTKKCREFNYQNVGETIKELL